MSRFLCILLAAGLIATVVTAEEVRWIPAAASNPGAFGSQWKTDLWLYSWVADAPIEVVVAFLPEDSGGTDPVEVTVEVPTGISVQLHDVVADLFGENRPGALRLRSEHPFEAQSRTYNDGGDNGTFGQGIPAVQVGEDSESWFLMGAANHGGLDGVRSNVGLINTTDTIIYVFLSIFDSDSWMVIGQKSVFVQPLSWTQVNIFDFLEVADVEVDNAVVIGFVPDNSGVLSYLSRVDNRSGDGTFSLPFYDQYVYIMPAQWEVVPTLTYTDGVTVSTLTYTGTDGSDVVVENPDSGWTETLIFDPPAEFCYEVEGTGPAGGGSVLVEIRTTRSGESTALYTHQEGVGGGSFSFSGSCIPLY